jgi:hypothetical protein
LTYPGARIGEALHKAAHLGAQVTHAQETLNVTKEMTGVSAALLLASKLAALGWIATIDQFSIAGLPGGMCLSSCPEEKHGGRGQMLLRPHQDKASVIMIDRRRTRLS